MIIMLMGLSEYLKTELITRTLITYNQSCRIWYKCICNYVYIYHIFLYIYLFLYVLIQGSNLVLFCYVLAFLPGVILYQLTSAASEPLGRYKVPRRFWPLRGMPSHP